MALRKQKKYNWKETNLAYFGSELEKQARQKLLDHIQHLLKFRCLDLFAIFIGWECLSRH